MSARTAAIKAVEELARSYALSFDLRTGGGGLQAIHDRLEVIIKAETDPKYRNPVPTVDIFIETRNGVIQIKRKNEPLGYALPGGFVNEGERFEDAAKREAIEETGLTDIKITEQFYTYTDRMRDPRSHITSTVFLATSEMEPVAGDDADAAMVVPVGELLKMLVLFPQKFAFDHGKIIADVLRYKHDGTRRRLG